MDASIQKTYLWQFTTVMRLHTNMRVHFQSNTSAGDFASLLLSIGDGTFPVADPPNVVALPRSIGRLAHSLDDLIKIVYPNISINAMNTKWLGEHGILAPLNSTVRNINQQLVNAFAGESVHFKSVDTAASEDESLHFPVEVLNSIEVSGLPHPSHIYIR